MSDIIHRCEECGAVLPEGTSSQRRYCDACRKLRRKEINHNYQKKHILGESPNPPVVRYCTVCGKALPAVAAANRKYCFSCSEKVRLDDARERARRALAAKPKVKKTYAAAKACTEGEAFSRQTPQGRQALQRVRHDDVRRGSRQNVLRCL